MQRIENVGSGLILKGGGSGAWNRKIREVYIYIYIYTNIQYSNLFGEFPSCITHQSPNRHALWDINSVYHMYCTYVELVYCVMMKKWIFFIKRFLRQILCRSDFLPLP